MSESRHSSGSQFLHDLITVDWSKADLYGAVKVATLIAPLLVIGLFTKHEPTNVILAGAFVLAIDLMAPPGPRTRLLLSVSVIYTATFAIGMLISMVDYLVAPLLALGLFFITYLKVYPKAFLPLIFAAVFFIISVPTHNTTLTATGIGSLEVVIGGLWATLLAAIFPSRKLKRQTTDQSVHERQSPAKLTRQDRFKPFTSNLSIHSKYFQYALAYAITSAIGLLITQWFKLPEPIWVLATILAILMPFADISVDFGRGVHRIIGTIIGCIIAIVIIEIIKNNVLLSLLLLLFAGIYVYVVRTKNYAFRTIFVVLMVLLLADISNPSRALISPSIRFENVIIGVSLSFLTLFIIWIVSKIKSNQALRKVG
jgi:uncharacterized membrane protein YgaE (UPF0421/DUF939 family)